MSFKSELSLLSTSGRIKLAMNERRRLSAMQRRQLFLRISFDMGLILMQTCAIFLLKNKFQVAQNANVPDVSTTSRCHVHRWTGGLVQSHDAGSCDGGNCVSSCYPAEDVL